VGKGRAADGEETRAAPRIGVWAARGGRRGRAPGRKGEARGAATATAAAARAEREGEAGARERRRPRGLARRRREPLRPLPLSGAASFLSS